MAKLQKTGRGQVLQRTIKFKRLCLFAKLWNNKVILLFLFPLLVILIYAIDIIDNTDTDFNQGTFFNTRLEGTGADANVTLNYTVIGISGCSECGNMSAGQLLYNITGNFTSEIKDSNSTSNIFNVISWTVNFVNTSDVVGAIYDAGDNDIAIFFKNGTTNRTYVSDLSQSSLQSDMVLTRFRGYNIDYDGSYDDILGFASSDTVDDYAVFLRNGSYIIDDTGLISQILIEFTEYRGYTIPLNFNSSDIVGFSYSPALDKAMVFFNNGSFVVDTIQTTLFSDISFTSYFAYTIPSSLSYKNIISVLSDNDNNDMCLLFINKSMVCNSSLVDYNSNITFSLFFNMTPLVELNISERTNISIFTQISNDSTTWTPFTEYSVINDGSYAELNATINTSQNVGRYIRYKADFKTTDKYFTPQLLNVSINYTIVDITIPRLNMTLNDTSLTVGDGVNISANVSDEIGLSFCRFVINQTGVNQYFNKSLTGINDRCSQNFSIATSGNIVNFTIIVNDTSNNLAQDSRIIGVDDTVNPVLNNCTISSTSITDASGNTINLTCEATDLSSSIQTMVATLNGTINKVLTFSFTQSQTIKASYIIFESAETLIVGSYSISEVNVTDTASNKLANTTKDLHFAVTSAPSGGGGSSGGGGGGTSVTVIERKIGIPLLSFGGLTLIDFPVIATPRKLTKLIRFKNVGNNTFENANVIVQGNADKYINAYVCNLEQKDCLNESINIKAGESRLLSLNGTFTEDIGEGTNGVVRIQEQKTNGNTQELNLLITRPPLFKLVIPIKNYTGLPELVILLSLYVLFGGGIILITFIVINL